MNKYTFTANGRTFERVSKAVAKKAFIAGFTIAFCTSNLRPGAPWHPEYITDRETGGVDEPATGFDGLLSSFEYFNCTDSIYTVFFLETGDNYIHFSFSNGSNPYVFYGNTTECMNELERWRKNYKIVFQRKHYYILTEKGAQV